MSELTMVREGLLARADVQPGEVVALRASRCVPCGLVAFPEREHCEGCGESVEAIELSIDGTLTAQTEVIHPPPSAEVPVPYGVGLVRFPEGIAILGLLDDALRESPAIGVTVETYAVEFREGELTYGFRRAAS